MCVQQRYPEYLERMEHSTKDKDNTHQSLMYIDCNLLSHFPWSSEHLMGIFQTAYIPRMIIIEKRIDHSKFIKFG